MSKPLKQKLLALLLFSLLLTLRRDGYFPFIANWPDEVWVWVSALHVVVIAALLILFFANWRMRWVDPVCNLFEKHHRWINVALAVISILAIFALQYQQARTYSEFYEYDIAVFGGVALVAMAIAVWSSLSPHRLAHLGIFAAAALLFVLPILYFPTAAKLSDLIPIIDKQLEAFTQGENIYQYYLLDNGISTQAVRQPGTTLSYMPAYLLNIDLRVMSVIFTLATGWVFVLFASNSNDRLPRSSSFAKESLDSLGVTVLPTRCLLQTILIIFLLFPYRHLRADLYEPFYWFLLSLTILFLSRRQLGKFALVWGMSIFTQVWSWLFSPLISLYLWKSYGWRTAFKYSFIYAFIGIGLLALFIVPDPQAYLEHVFNYYQRVRDNSELIVTTMFLIPIMTYYDLRSLMSPLQLLGVFSVGVIYLQRMVSLEHLLEGLAIVMFVFLQFNYLSWNYMYINVLVLMMLYLLVETVKSKS